MMRDYCFDHWFSCLFLFNSLIADCPHSYWCLCPALQPDRTVKYRAEWKTIIFFIFFSAFNPRLKKPKEDREVVDGGSEAEDDEKIDLFGDNPHWEPSWVQAYRKIFSSFKSQLLYFCAGLMQSDKAWTWWFSSCSTWPSGQLHWATRSKSK